MTEIIKLFQGATSDVKLVRPEMPSLPDALDGNWNCKYSVLDCDDAVVVAATAVTDKTTDTNGQERYVVAVTPTQSATLTVPAGEPWLDYTWVIQLENTTTTPPYNKEHAITLRVRRQGIPPLTAGPAPAPL